MNTSRRAWAPLRPPSILARVMQGWTVLEHGKTGKAAALAREVLDIAEQTEDPYGKSLAMNFAGFSMFISGRYEQAVKILEEGLAICESDGFGNSRATIIGNLGAALARAGRCAEAVSLAESWLEDEATRCGSIERIYAWRGCADAYSTCGDHATALRLANRALAYAREIGSPCFEARMLETRISIRRNAGDGAELTGKDRARLTSLYSEYGLSPLFNA